MKKIFYSSALCLLLFTLLFSCSKSSPEPVAAKGKLISTVGGAAWESEDAYALIGSGTISLVAINKTGTSIQFDISKSANTGTYNFTGIGATAPEATATMTQDGEAVYKSTNYSNDVMVGTITITEIDETNKTVSGKFSLKMKQLVPTETEVEIKSGSFTKIPYSKSTTPPQTYSGFVGGQPFSPSIIGGTSSGGSITLSVGASLTSIKLVVPDNATTGAHALRSLGTAYYGTLFQAGDPYATNWAGMITITAHNTTVKRIVASFYFSQSTNPTVGSFAISYK